MSLVALCPDGRGVGMVIDGQPAKAKRCEDPRGRQLPKGRPEVPAAHFRPLSIREEGTLHPVRPRRGAGKGAACLSRWSKPSAE
ncbi:hypothetical protein MPL3365_20279 [Mesorhizobium plurifarium]|uniref:Uncharacterized protein n=1 Tax=Mesorhizobium plurifarium TaxID=69974 RepID=A0A090GU09_MESPL|nr:hypothetical protein MPL3365_20279 [Mesorhizobium plurifarium]